MKKIIFAAICLFTAYSFSQVTNQGVPNIWNLNLDNSQLQKKELPSFDLEAVKAEDAANEAKPIIVQAIKNMTVRDAINIVKGEDNEATNYLKKNTFDSLYQKFIPPIQTSLEKVNATKHWSTVISRYNKIPMVQKVNPDLDDYVTRKALDGLFIMIAKEEKKIRDKPLARVTETLKKVFDWVDSQKMN